MMLTKVTYTDYNEVISEIDIPVGENQNINLKVTTTEDPNGAPIDNGDGTTSLPMIDVVAMTSSDLTTSLSMTHNMNKTELRDFVQILQKLIIQMK